MRARRPHRTRLAAWTSAAAAAWLALGAAALARPPGPPPDRSGPPAAWVETRGGDRWLAFSSYCWSTGPGAGPATGRCVDLIPPRHRRDLPTIRLRAGELVRFHLGFRPRSVSLNLGRRSFPLSNVAAPSWRVSGRGGIGLLFATHPRGDASYAARVVVLGWRPPGPPVKTVP